MCGRAYPELGRSFKKVLDGSWGTIIPHYDTFPGLIWASYVRW